MLLVMVFFWPVQGTAAENIRRVALFPFEIHSNAPAGDADLEETVYQGVAT
jgi:hypothetical protein